MENINFNNFKTELELQEKYALTQNELFALKAIMFAQDGNENDYFVLLTAVRGELIEILASLQKKGVINKCYEIPRRIMEFDPMEVPLFDDTVSETEEENVPTYVRMGSELEDVYPMFALINGKIEMLGSGFKGVFDSIDDFYKFYCDQINWDEEKHKEIIDLINWEQENDIGCIIYSMADFVKEHKWEEIKQVKEDIDKHTV